MRHAYIVAFQWHGDGPLRPEAEVSRSLHCGFNPGWTARVVDGEQAFESQQCKRPRAM